MRGLDLGSTNPVKTGECWMCVCVMGGVCGECVGGLDQGLEG